jgi:rhodanese-related sulfurtransferase
MRILKILFLLAAVGAAWDALWPVLTDVRQMLPWRLAELMEKGEAPLIVDVRTRWEHEWFHVPGAISDPYPMGDPMELGLASKDAAIVIVCMTGHRSMLDTYTLTKQGYSEVYNLTWGSAGWELMQALLPRQEQQYAALP